MRYMPVGGALRPIMPLSALKINIAHLTLYIDFAGTQKPCRGDDENSILMKCYQNNGARRAVKTAIINVIISWVSMGVSWPAPYAAARLNISKPQRLFEIIISGIAIQHISRPMLSNSP